MLYIFQSKSKHLYMKKSKIRRGLTVLLWSVLSCFLVTLQANAQQRTVTGVITDQSGGGLPGATVSVKGSSITAVTDANGGFSLNVPGTARSIVVSYVGKQSKEV